MVGWIAALYKWSFDSCSEKVFSKVKSWFSINFVIPSTLYLHSCILINGLEAETASISPAYASLLKIGLFLTHTDIFRFAAEEWGWAYAAPKRYLSIMMSKSASINLPLASLITCLAFFWAFYSSIWALRSSLCLDILSMFSSTVPFLCNPGWLAAGYCCWMTGALYYYCWNGYLILGTGSKLFSCFDEGISS